LAIESWLGVGSWEWLGVGNWELGVDEAPEPGSGQRGLTQTLQA
jgi:hypothetical protein